MPGIDWTKPDAYPSDVPVLETAEDGRRFAMWQEPCGSGIDEMLIAERLDNPPEFRWYWCAGDAVNLDDNVCGFVRGFEECVRYCRMVAEWRRAQRASQVTIA